MLIDKFYNSQPGKPRRGTLEGKYKSRLACCTMKSRRDMCNRCRMLYMTGGDPSTIPGNIDKHLKTGIPTEKEKNQKRADGVEVISEAIEVVDECMKDVWPNREQVDILLERRKLLIHALIRVAINEEYHLGDKRRTRINKNAWAIKEENVKK